MGVMQVIDALHIGGQETVAVGLANYLPAGRFRKYLCTTRPNPQHSSLAGTLQDDVFHLALDRRGRFDVPALFRFRKFIRDQQVSILHVHGSSLFFSRIASALFPMRDVRILWHDHYGRCEFNERSARLYRMAVAGISGVITVNQRLAEWARRELRVPRERVWYVPNFALPQASEPSGSQLPGEDGSRIICLANLRPQKDHLTLIRAMAAVSKRHPSAHLLLAGAGSDREYEEILRKEVTSLTLSRRVTFLGHIANARSLLAACDVGVLSSSSEGLPLSLLEYGYAGLASVATRVGECPAVLDDGRAGVVVEPGNPAELADALNHLLDSPDRRAAIGRTFQEFVQKTYDPAAIIEQVCEIYDQVLSEN